MDEAKVCIVTFDIPNQPPVVDGVSANPVQGEAPLSVSFTCEAHDPDEAVASYDWDFDGGGAFEETTTSGTVSHTFGDPGSYTVTVRATDNEGPISNSMSVSVEVTPEGGSQGGDQGNGSSGQNPANQYLISLKSYVCSNGNCQTQDSFHVGDHVVLKLCIDGRPQNAETLTVDECIAFAMPDGSLLFLTQNPFSPLVPYNEGTIGPSMVYSMGLTDLSGCTIANGIRCAAWPDGHGDRFRDAECRGSGSGSLDH